MKKEKLPVINRFHQTGFVDYSFDFDTTFAGYPDFDIDLSSIPDIGEQFAALLDHIVKLIQFAGRHPANMPQYLFTRTIGFSIVFESFEQQDNFIRQLGLDKLGTLDCTGEEFAEVLRIDMETGTRKPFLSGSAASPGFSFSLPKFDLPAPGKRKPAKEVSDTLKAIRADEKKLASYMEWTAEDGGVFTVVFRTEEEMRNTLKALDMELEWNGKYLWGPELAAKIGLELVPCHFREKGMYQGREKRLEELVITDADYEAMGIKRDRK